MLFRSRLASPRHHLITGVRVYAQPLICSAAGAITIEATKTGAAYASDAAFEDMVFLTQCGVLQIDHNNKTIVEQPTGLTPGNYGFAGIANVDYAAGTGSQSVTIVGSSGLAQTFGNRAFMLKPNEQFEVKITYPQVRQSGGSTTMQAQKGRYLTVILDGQSIRARR